MRTGGIPGNLEATPALCLGGPLDGEMRPPHLNGDLIGRSSDRWLWQGSPDPNVRAMADYYEGDYRQIYDPRIWPWRVEWRWIPSAALHTVPKGFSRT